MRLARGFGAGLSILVLVGVITATLVASADVGDTVRVSVDADGIQGSSHSQAPAMSSDGRYIAFESAATNLVEDDTNGQWDIFVHDFADGTTVRANLSTDGVEADGQSYSPSISADGRYVAFESLATNLVDNDTNDTADVFVRDLVEETTTLVSRHSDGTQGDNRSEDPMISADGNFVAFTSEATILIDDDSNFVGDVFVHDLQTSSTTRVSTGPNGAEANGLSTNASISADGRYVAFDSNAPDLGGDTNGQADVFVHDRQVQTTTLVSIHSDGTQGNGRSYHPSISADGRYIAFDSFASNLVEDDTNDYGDVFVRDLVGESTTLISTNADGTQGDNRSAEPSISANGTHIAFESRATNLGESDSNSQRDVFVHDLDTGTNTLISTHSNGTQADSDSYHPALTAEGRYVAFASEAANLVDDDTNWATDVFIHQYLDNPPPPTTTTTTGPSTTTTVPATTTTTPETAPTTTPAPTTTTAPVPPTTVPEATEVDHFADDDGHIFEDDINAIAEAGITVGCNPPENTQFCPDESFLRGQAAAFVRRALDVPASAVDHFTDDDTSVFEDDINAIAEQHITIGCNPPDNTTFCPTDPFTRGQAAAFVRRALNVPATDVDHFTDDDGHIFEDDINAIAEAGITIGCNPSDNNHYCPDDLLTRGQAAAFMRRALLD